MGEDSENARICEEGGVVFDFEESCEQNPDCDGLNTAGFWAGQQCAVAVQYLWKKIN